MTTYEGKSRKNASRPASSEPLQRQGSVESDLKFADKRTESTAQRKLQEMADTSLQMRRLGSFQERANNNVIQQKPLDRNKLNVAGESHPESGPRRAKEKQYTEAMTGGIYKTEGEFKAASSVLQPDRFGDPMLLRAEMLLAILKEKTLVAHLTPFSTGTVPAGFPVDQAVGDLWDIFKVPFKKQLDEIALALVLASNEKAEETQAVKAANTHTAVVALSGTVAASAVADVGTTIIPAVNSIITTYATDVLGAGDIRAEATVSALRSSAMQGAAADNAGRWVGKQKGVWKVGQSHVAEIAGEKQGTGYELMTKDEFNADFEPWLLNNP